MSEAEAIAKINDLKKRLSLATHGSRTFEALDLALKLLRAQEQNEPLTKEQLFNMTGEPVYVVYNDNTPSGWFIASEQWWTSEKGMVGFGDVWNAYARKPKGADQ